MMVRVRLSPIYLLAKACALSLLGTPEVTKTQAFCSSVPL